MTSELPQFGRYPTLGVLGEGGMGKVYLARHPELGCDLAIKAMLSARGADDFARKRFQREVRALTQLRHPGVVAVVDAGEQDGVPWLAMIKVEGESLESHLRTRGSLSPAQTVSLGLQLCDALGAAHASGILHRDLKPDNVLCAPNERYVVTDFGLTKELSREASVRLSQTGVLQGTPGYWAPEQASGKGSEATAQTDVYGIGAVLYAALTSAPPIAAGSLIEAVVATLERAPTPPSELASVPADLERVVLRCLEKEPAARWLRTAELRGALATSLRDKEDVPRKRGGGIVPLGASLLVLGLVAVAASQLRSGDEVAHLPSPKVTTPPPPTASDVRAAAAQALLERAGLAFERGRHREAVGLYRVAAEEGSPKAMHNLGVMYAGGLGVAKDEAQAVVWYRRAADEGYPSAMVNLGGMYAGGLGVAKDEAQAVVWYRRAADEGYPSAMVNLGGMYAGGLGVAKDEAQAADWYRRAAEKGYPGAMVNLGFMLAGGLGVAKDEAQAVVWYRRAAERGDPVGMVNLGFMLAGGLGVAKDEAQAVVWLRRAAEEGHAEAMFGLGVMLANGRGVAKDEPAAIEWYRRVVQEGDSSWQNRARGALKELGAN